jgi:hypothetical protein
MKIMKKRLREIIVCSVLAGALAGGVAGFLISKYLYTPIKGWTADINNDGKEDIVLENRLKKRAVIYGISNSEKRVKEFISGEELSRRLNEQWKKDYENYFGKKPTYNKFNMHTQWEYW